MNLFGKKIGAKEAKEDDLNLINKKSLIIYFSHTGENYMEAGIKNIDKGNTEIDAEYIQEITGGNLFKVEPKNEYPYNYNECCDVAKKELKTDARPEIKNKIENIDEYEVIYLGSPIWWGHMAMPMFSAIENLDFTGKVVKVFITHEGSSLGSCMKDAEKLCKGANIMPGLPIRGCKVKESKEIIKNWIK